MKRAEFVNKVFQKLEQNHIFLYHDISKEEFEKHKQKFLVNIDELDETHFEAGILKLFALFKDAHTNYWGVKFDYVDANIILVGKEFYIKQNGHFKKITSVNGHKIEEVVDKLKELIPYEVEPWAYAKIKKTFIYSPKAMEMIDCGLNKKEILFGCENGEELVTTLSTKMQKEKPKRKPLYESKKLNNKEILYIRYRGCSNMEGYPFAKFVEDVAQSCKELPKACLVDIRYNTGGNSEVIMPLINWLKENKIKSYMLMNGFVFSSGTFALGYFKKYLNATLLGTEAGQPTRCYGECLCESIDEKEFTYCKKYFELTSCHDKNAPIKYFGDDRLEFFDYIGAIKPDIRIEQKVEDLEQGLDTQLEESLKIINSEAVKQDHKEISRDFEN